MMEWEVGRYPISEMGTFPPTPSEEFRRGIFDSLLLLGQDDNANEEEEEEEEDEEEEDDEEEEEEEDEDEWETDDEEEGEFDDIYASQEELEDREASGRKSLPDVEGAIPKTILRKLPNSTIRKIIVHVKKHILMLETENYLYEKTIEKLEASEKDIDSKLPNTTDAEFEDHLKKTRVLICSSESEDEPEDTGEYEPIHAADEIRISQDSFFENMSDNSKATAFAFFRTVGDLAPTNYDVMRHKYGDYVGTAAEKLDFTGEPGVKTRLSTKIFQSRVQLDEKMSSAAAAVVKTGGGKSSLDASTSSDSVVEDEDFAGFNLADAKKLSITDKLRFALEEEEEFRKRFYQHETQALKDESAIQVHIDAHKHALGILMGIRKDFQLITKGATGAGMNGKIMADLLVKFRRKMRNQLSAEETKARITIRKVMTQKKRTIEQLKINKEAGRSISHIDFEYLLCESSILETEINGMNNTLQHLKDLTAQFHLVLQDEREMLNKMVVQEKKMNQELKRRHDLLHHFHNSYARYRYQIVEAHARMDAIKKKLNEFQAPQPLDYIRLKAKQYNLENEVHSLERRLEEVNVNLINIKGNYRKYLKNLPGGRTTEMENEAWLQEIKKEVKENGLMEMLREEDATEQNHGTGIVLPAALRSQSQSTAGSIMSHRALPSAPNILMAPRRFDSQKAMVRKSRVMVYDLDFDLDEDLSKIDDGEANSDNL